MFGENQTSPFNLNDRDEMGLMLALSLGYLAAHEGEQDIKHQVNGRCSDSTELQGAPCLPSTGPNQGCAQIGKASAGWEIRLAWHLLHKWFLCLKEGFNLF